MACLRLSLCLLAFLLCLAVCSCSKDSVSAAQKASLCWCVAKVSAPDDKLQGFLDYACSQVDCGPIQAGAPCFEPNTLRNHASFALDQWYKTRGECQSDIGVLSLDPSYEGCQYPKQKAL